MTTLMRAVDIHGGAGSADALFINDQTPKPVPGAGEALVRVRAFGLNRMDLLQREGKYPVPPQAPATLGVELSGIIEALGPVAPAASTDSSAGVSWAVGDAVFGLVYGGAYAEFAVVPQRMLLRKPPGLSWVEAACLPETWITALQALHEVGGFPTEAPNDNDDNNNGSPASTDSNKGRTVLWHAAASGVSIAGIQLSRLAGARAVYATAGSDSKCEFAVHTLGATAAVNYRTGTVTSSEPTKTTDASVDPSTRPSWAAPLLATTAGVGVDLIVDYIGASYFQQNLTVAARDGRIVLLAMLGGATLPAGVDLSLILRKRLRIEGSSLRSRSTAYQVRLRDRLAAVLPHFVGPSPALRVVVDRIFPWTQIHDAHTYMESNASTGKIACTIP